MEGLGCADGGLCLKDFVVGMSDGFCLLSVCSYGVSMASVHG